MKGKYTEVKINNKPYPVAFNKYALGKFCRSQNISLTDLTDGKIKEDLETFLRLAYFGLVGGAAAKNGTELKHNYIECCMLFEEDDTALENIMAVWADQMPAQEKAENPQSVGKP